VALVEIVIGIVGGNLIGLHVTPAIDTLANFGVVFLTFLAGAEIDPQSLRQNLKPSLAIGLSSFLVPFAIIGLFTYYVAGWELKAALIAGLALSTTSVAVIYTMLTETGLASSSLGKLLLAACFITDFSAVLTLGLISIDVSIWLAILFMALVLSIWLVPKALDWAIRTFKNRISHPDNKLIIMFIFILSWLAISAGSSAVLPSYVMGIACAGVLARHRAMINRLQIIMFTIWTPFYFIKAGSYVSITAVATEFTWIFVFLALNMATKFIGVWPLTRVFNFPRREGMYSTLLMSTGLTFGIISALYGLTEKIITADQYAILLAAVVGSALVPSLIAQTWFKPSIAAGPQEP
jgi:Kef-type K+ transport system membrane component KefB